MSRLGWVAVKVVPTIKQASSTNYFLQKENIWTNRALQGIFCLWQYEFRKQSGVHCICWSLLFLDSCSIRFVFTSPSKSWRKWCNAGFKLVFLENGGDGMWKWEIKQHEVHLPHPFLSPPSQIRNMKYRVTEKTSQELQMLSTDTLNFQVTKIVMNSCSQLSELQSVSQLSQVCRIVL